MNGESHCEPHYQITAALVQAVTHASAESYLQKHDRTSAYLSTRVTNICLNGLGNVQSLFNSKIFKNSLFPSVTDVSKQH